MQNTSLTQGLTNAGGGLFLDAQGNFQQVQKGAAGANNQWMWGSNGLQGIGGATPTAINDPFLGIQEQYRGGNAIEANSWQEAVSKSLEGFMRSNYGADPIFNWQAGQSGLNGQGQFRLGTLQELANAGNIPGNFFDTTGTLARNVNTGQLVNSAGDHTTQIGGMFDSLMGFGPDQKFLGFEDIPLEQLEKLKGGVPGSIFVGNSERAALARQSDELTAKMEALRKGGKTSDYPEIRALASQIQGINARIPGLDPFISLAQAQSTGSLQDYNDFMFALDMQQYQKPDELVKANPKDVLKQFFETPQYQLTYGSEPGVLDPNASPTDRFRADPGYQWTQDEGMRQIQRNSSAKGLLESGATQRDLQTFGQGMADQNYQRFIQQNNGLYDDWQAGLQGLSSQGAQLSAQSGQNANSLGSLLSALSSSQGNNLASLLGNQGVYGANSYMNTGGAMASTAQNASSLLAQVLSANMQAAGQSQANQAAQQGANNAGASSQLSGIGNFIGSLGSLF